MVGRYGNDELNKFLFIVSLVLIVLNLFLQIRALHVLVVLIIIVLVSLVILFKSKITALVNTLLSKMTSTAKQI